MIAVTGGAGFIGSAIIYELNRRGVVEILAVDEFPLASEEKKKNIERLKYVELIDKNDFLSNIKNGGYKDLTHIIHMGACSSTVEQNILYLVENNYEYSKALAKYSIENGVKLIYASSAATYGSGDIGFKDEHEMLEQLKPLNLYGYSKQLFDLWAKKNAILDKITGLKYFNVYGPNEYHKGDMRSFVHKAYGQIRQTGKVRLFKSYEDKYSDGEQMRDFIYIKDAVSMTLYFYENPELGGIYNIGTGSARSWNDLVKAVFSAMDKEVDIEYIDMPENIKEQYQYYTCADMNKLKASGYKFSPMTLEDGVADYVRNYIIPEKHLENV
jgi:ADP-L-glycero-D-manno-heptose 6-epimerase